MRPAPADLDEDRVEGVPVLAHDLHPHGALAGDDVLVVEGRDEDHPVLGGQRIGPRLRVVVGLAFEHHLRPEPLDRLDLDARCGLRHDDEGRGRRAGARPALPPARGCRPRTR